jgi:hypothetical protein
MSSFLRVRILLPAAALFLITAVAADTFGQSSGLVANISNPTSPNNTASSTSTSRDTALKSPPTVGNFPVIVPSELNGGSKTDKSTNKTEDKSTNTTGDGDDATPPAPPSPAPQGGVSAFSGRTFSRDRNGPQQFRLTGIKLASHVNALVGGFDQGAGFGFGMEFTTAKDGDLKGFEFYARALGSTRLYHAGELGARVGNNNTRGEVWFNYTRRTRDSFFGFGSLNPRTARTNYETERRSYNGLFAQKFTKNIEAGLYGAFSSTGSYPGENDRDIAIDTLFSGNPAVTPIAAFLPGFQQNVRLVSYGAFAEIDLRNNERGLTRGGYFYGRFGGVDGLDTDNTFSDFGWLETELDGRVYIPVFSSKTSLALRGYAVLREPKGGSQIPFYEQAFFGGRSFGRGFQNFRFRGNNSLLFSSEVRQTVLSMNDENTSGLDLIVFGDVGQVWGDNRSRIDPAILLNENFDSRNYRTGFGGGIQYRVNKSFAFRIEIGASNERILNYVSLRPGF